MVFDHIDVRVADVTAVQPFYDTFLKAFGFRGQRQANGDVVYYRVSERRVQEAIAVIESHDHVLSQIAVHDGIRVIGTASPRHHDALRAMGVEPVDYNAPDLAKRIRALAPAGVDAAFDHLGLESVRVSYGLLRGGGSIISYGNALLLNGGGSMLRAFIALLSQLALWNLLPNSRRASFYNIWAGSSIAPKSFRSRQRADLTALFTLLSTGAINPPIAARFPLTEVSAAMSLAESRTVQGKVVLIPSLPLNDVQKNVNVKALL